MKIKSSTKSLTFAFLFVAVSTLSGLLAASPVSADPDRTTVTCQNGKKVTARKNMRPDRSILDEKDFRAACSGNGGYGGSKDGGGKEPAKTGCASVDTSVIKCNNDGGNPIMSIVLQLTNFLAVGVGIAVVGGIVWGSLLYTTANGDSGKAQQGIAVIVNAVIGLLLFIFAYAIVNFLVPGGIL